MGDLQLLAIQPNGFVLEEALLSPSSPPPLLSNPSPASISDDIWKIAEFTTQGIIRHIQPTVVSEQRRKEVIEYVQGLLKGYLGCEVFPFGSVPLKTYLPDGDIDLTALSMQTLEEGLASEVRAVLEGEEQSKDAGFEVKDVQYIHAEVKLVKCLVQNIVVDISFNQLGGICTLCFLEQVDRLIGKNHLFKRSIILIKSWCYYESRILGAHHGLISTYALETMVLYIFHLFHSSLNGPLAVLYRFLDYYSKFDWENFCISLNGPVSLSSLPEIVAETPDNDGGELLLDKDFLKHCVDVFSVPSKGFDAPPRSFLKKNLNIIDPLKENNNLGRSISRGNSYRIRSAFTYGARKLGEILLLRASDIADELNKFFTNTLDRHGSGQRPDVQVSMPTSSPMGSNLASSRLAVERCVGSKTLPKSASFGSSSTVGEHSLELQEGSGNTQLSGLHRKSSIGGGKEPQRCASGLGSSLEILERLGYIKENGFTGCPLVGDAENHATSRNPSPMVTVRTSESMPQSCESVTSPLGKGRDAPNLYLPPTFREPENIETKNLDKLKATSPAMHENKISSRVQGTDREMHAVSQKDNGAFKLGANHKFGLCGNGLVTGGKMDAQCASTLLDPADSSAGNTGRFGVFNSLSDLSGDYDSHINSLMCAQWCHDYTLSGSFMPMRPLPTQFLNNFCQPMHFRQNVFPHINANGVFPGPRFFPVHPPMLSGAAFGVEEFAKPRGTGTYLPNPNEGSYKEWNSLGRRSAPPVPQANLVRPLCDNNWATTQETHFFENIGHVPRKEKFFSPAVHAKPPPPVFFQDNHPMSRGTTHTNGFSPPLEKVEFGTFGKLPSGLPSPDACRQPVSVKNCPGQFLNTPTVTSPEPIPDSGVNVEGEKKEAYHLKNEADFPPLSARETSISK